MANPNIPPGPGRPKGIPNKLTMEVKEMVRQALEGAGGVEYLKQQAKSNPGPFLALIGKVIPTDIKLEIKNPLMKIEAEDVARLIQSIGRSRGIAIPSSIGRIIDQEARTLPAIQETEGIS